MRPFATARSTRRREKDSYIQVRIVFGISLLSLSALCLLAAPVPSGTPSNYPSWWFARGVIVQTNTNPSPTYPSDYAAPDDYAVLNQGQLKNFATQAYSELQAQAPPFIWSTAFGTNLTALVNSWNPASGDAYAAVNLGQLKTVAQPFYNILIQMGYPAAYPWTGANADDYATANIGQAKNIFSFDVGYSSFGNGIPDWWEFEYFGTNGYSSSYIPNGNGLSLQQDYQQGNDPNNYYCQGGTNIAPVISIAGGNYQCGLAGQFLTNSLVIEVQSASGMPLTNAPVQFWISQGGGGLSTSPSGGPITSILTTTTGSGGIAQAYFENPNIANCTNAISVSAGGSQTNFIATTALDINAPAAPSNGTVTPGIAPGEIDLTWVNNADNASYIIIQQSTDQTNWTTIATLNDPTSTSYSATGLTQGQTYYFRIAAGN